ncbi:MAG: hypothetical protein DWH81_12350 [Planctomycetota bacterium]|nr:MAG: hypothetical protein DWH81_12350 [Planctomycetota bacterium]
MNLLLGVCLALGIGLLAGAVFRNRHRLLILGLITCGGVVLATVTVVYYSMFLRAIFPGSSSPGDDPIWSSPVFAPVLFCQGAMISVVGYQIGQRVTRSDNSNAQLSKYPILIRCLPSLFAILMTGFLIGQNWVYRQQLAGQARLQQVASVSYSNDEPTFSWLQLRNIPARLRPLLSRDNVPTFVHFQPGIKNPGRYLQESGFTRLQCVEFHDADIDAQDILSLSQNLQLGHLTFEKCRFSEDALRSLKSTPSLAVLNIRECSLSPGDKWNVSGLPFLLSLDLSGTYTSDEFLSGLTGHPFLQLLFLRDSPISDAGVQHIRNLPMLHALDLSGTRVTGTGLKGMKAPLNRLKLDGTPIDDTMMQAISQISSLETLSLARTKVTSAGVAQLVKLPRLSTLMMDECDVGDEVRVHLSSMSSLKSWSARNTRMTAPDFHNP